MENTNTENRKQFGWITASHPVIYPRYDPAKFIGRSWLVDQVAAMGRESDLQHLVIIGEPGSGKSALIAYLAEAWNCPRHFIRADNKGGVVGVDAKSFLVSIGAQLYQKYGREIFRPDRVLRVNVHAGVAEDQAKIIGLLVDEMFELPFLLQEDRLHGHIEVQVDNARAGSQVTGEHIRHLVNVAQSLHETALLHAAVLEPLQNLHVLYPDETVFLLIDALDESVEHPGRRIVDILPRGGMISHRTCDS